MNQADQEWSRRADRSVEDDMELARRMQNQELRCQSEQGSRENENGYGGIRPRTQRSRSFQDEDEALALRLMEEENSRNCNRRHVGDRGQHYSPHDDDLELARRMQNLEHQGLGMMNSHTSLGSTLSRDEGSGSDINRMNRLRQEQEDEMIARNLLLRQSSTDLTDRRSASNSRTENSGPSHVQQSSSSSRPSSSHPSEEETPRRSPSNTAIPVGPSTPHPSESFPIPSAAPEPQPTADPPQTSVAPVTAAVTPAAVNQTPTAPVAQPPKEKKKKKLFGMLRGRSNDKDRENDARTVPVPMSIPQPTRTPGPLPNSVSIDRPLPIAASPQQVADANARTKKKAFMSRPPSGSSVPCCVVCNKPAPRHLATLGKRYHPECFKCVGCHEIIDPSVPFAFSTDPETGEKHPLHRKCYATLYGVKCAVCQESIPTGPDGRVSYVKHPFFEKEQMCPSHALNPGRRCTGCHRFEPSSGLGFADLGDADRCVCLSCCRSVVVDSEDARALWKRVIHFMEKKLNLPLWGDMRETPVLVVGHDALNDQLQDSAHSGSSQIMTRGLCLSEHQSGRRFAMHRMRFNKDNRSFQPADPESKGFTFFQVPDGSKVNPDASVTAILCLSGLPSDLTASVLVHEATHAWIKLHPNYDIAYPIPMQVEEGVCQLMSFLFLTEGLDPASTDSDENGPSDEKLRQYFKFCIETDENEIYGDGYRLAAEAYANIGIEALLSHVVMYKKFPKV